MAANQQSTARSIDAMKDGKTAVAVKPVNAMRDALNSYRGELSKVLPKHLTPDRMVRLALTAFSQSADLQKCSHQSIIASIMLASQVGLEIGVDGQGFLIPYKGTCTFVPGWKGLVDLVSRSGRASVWTGAVFDGDFFEWGLGDTPFVQHRPCGEDDESKLICTYAIGRVKGSDWPIIEVWPAEKIWRHRDRLNKQGGRHYSFKEPEMYARKVPLLQVLKYMPKSTELAAALAAAEADERGMNARVDENLTVIVEDFPPSNTPQSDGDAGGPDEGGREAGAGDAGVVEGGASEKTKDAKAGAPETTADEVRKALNAAESIDALNEAALLIPAIASREQAKALNALYLERQEALGAS